MSESKFDVIIVGAGPAGYVCAIRCAQLGLKTACIDKREALGGTCLNVGCIPSKALLQSSFLYYQAQEDFSKHGIKVKSLKLDLEALMKRKTEVVEGLTKGIDFLFKKNEITRITGAAKLLKEGKVDVDGQIFEAEHIILATGSEVTPLKGLEIDEKTIVSSTGALSLKEAPKHLVVIGGGYIGLEMGSVWSRLGSKVTVVEYADRIIPGMDDEVANLLQRVLTRQGFGFKLSTSVEGAKKNSKGLTLDLKNQKTGQAESIDCDVALVSAGRRPFSEGLGLEELGVAQDKKGFVLVNGQYQTSVDGIYAIGDLIGGLMLAHKGEEEGIAVAEFIAGKSGHVNYNAIPGVIYTHPEVATVGKTEQQLKEEGIAYTVGKFPFQANSRARANGDVEGFVKIITEKRTDKILGVHIIGPEAGTLIAETVLAMEFGASAEDVARTCHAHPTLNEAVKEAALAADGRAIHI